MRTTSNNAEWRGISETTLLSRLRRIARNIVLWYPAEWRVVQWKAIINTCKNAGIMILFNKIISVKMPIYRSWAYFAAELATFTDYMHLIKWIDWDWDIRDVLIQFPCRRPMEYQPWQYTSTCAPWWSFSLVWYPYFRINNVHAVE